MSYLLDTNVISAARRAGREPAVEAWFRARRETELFLSVVTLGEVERGIERVRGRDPVFAADLRSWIDQTVQIFEDRVLAFEAEDAVLWGKLSADAGHQGVDLMIAAQALIRGMTVVTRNVSHFSPSGVTTLDPFAS